ncbi:hypothetical protein, partial [Pseudomonas fulva]|uniref:hypothetical protein n=1 Tax=Pseudomonas fulva TaxID=47880 RepID=UPI0034D3CC44
MFLICDKQYALYSIVCSCFVCLEVSTTTDMESNFVHKGIELIKQAVSADNSGKLDEAFSLYTRAFHHFVLGIKY